MQNYLVQIDVRASVEIEVSAENEAEAERLALQEANQMSSSDIDVQSHHVAMVIPQH